MSAARALLGLPGLFALLCCSTPAAVNGGKSGSSPASASPAAWPPGPEVGQPLPAFEAVDHEGHRQTFETLRGPQGLVLNFNRSAVW